MERMLNFDAPEKRPNVGLPGDSKSDLSAMIHTHKAGFDFYSSFEHSRGTLREMLRKSLILFLCFHVQPIDGLDV